MRSYILLLVFCLTTVLGQPTVLRILGGSLTTIQRYPYAAAVLTSSNQADYSQACGGVILNDRSILSAAHCFYRTSPNIWRVRVGSSIANSGGSVHNVAALIAHPNFEYYFKENDIGIFRISSSFSFGGNIQPGKFAGANYRIADNLRVWTIGWGATSIIGPLSKQLRQVQIRTINLYVCRDTYDAVDMMVSNHMLCAGNFSLGNQGPCTGDFGGPLLYNELVIGISSWGYGCGYQNYPAVFTRVPNFIDWIQSNA